MPYPMMGMGGYIAGPGAIVGSMGTPKWLGPIITDATGSLTLTSGRAYAQYLGEVPRPTASMLAEFYLHGVAAVAGGGGAALNWAEVAVATGDLGEMPASVSLTVIGTPTSISAQVTAAGTQWYGVTITAPIPPRKGLWLVFASAYETTQVSVRIPSNFLNARGYAAISAGFQPSAQVGVATAFTLTATTGTAVPIMGGHYA